VQRPVPVVVGGDSPAAFRRAARSGDGWYGWRHNVEDVAARLRHLREAEVAADRDVPLEVTVTPGRGARPDAVTVRAFGDLGVDRLVLRPPATDSVDDLLAFVEAHAPERLGARARA
jgi:hypothetical protein